MTRHVLDAFGATVARAPDRPALVFLENGDDEIERLDFLGVRTRAAALAAWVRERARPGERVLILHRPGPEYVAAFLGSVWAGCIAVPAIPPRPGARIERLKAILANARPSLALTDRAITLDGLECFDTRAISADWAERAPALRSNPDGIAFLQYTSGSTRAPRGVVVTHDNLLHNVQCIRDCLDATPGAVSVTWLPPYHDMGLIGALLEPLLVGMTTVLMPPVAFLQRPLRWLQAISRYRASHSGGPDFAYALCARSAERDRVADLDLSSWRVAYQGAEPVRAETLDRFMEAFGPAGFHRSAFVPCYGLAEATLMVTGVDAAVAPHEIAADSEALARGSVELARPKQQSRRLISCGPPRPGIDVRIVDPDSGTALPDGRIGEIWIAGASVAAGYWENSEETRETFDATLADGTGRFLRSGDLGALSAGELVVTGRLKDLIIVDGRNHAAHDVEDAVSSSHTAFVPGGAAAFSVEPDGAERVVVVQEIERGALGSFDATAATAAARARVSEEHGLALWDLVFVRVRTLPRTSSGKLRRGECRRAYAAGELERLATERPVHEIESLARSLLAAHVKIEPDSIDATAPLASLGLDSKSAVVFSGELSRGLGRELPPTVCYEHPSLEKLVRYLAGGAEEKSIAAWPRTASPDEPIAVIGIGCRFPGARGPEAFARLLSDGRDAVTRARPASRPDAAIPGAGGFLDDPSEFDRERFGILPREAEHMDPQQRLVLEVAWEALEHASIAPDSLAGAPAGVFVGISNFDYSRSRDADPSSATGNALSIAANRLSYVLDLRGPSLSIDTACSSSLVAVHQACRALGSGECEVALAGGVNLMLDGAPNQVLEAAGMLSPDGRCRTFDAGANGYVRGEGCGFVVLEPLSRAIERGHDVLAVIRGSAVNQDGRTNGLTAPSAEAQRAVVDAAWRRAGIGVDDVGYVEAHGTGTPLGDPIEFNALAAALRGRASAPCWVGSVKTNIGHLEAAAGIAGLIKAVLSVRAGEIFSHLHVASINPALQTGGPIAVVERGARWQSERRIAAVSSFGFGGTNAHVVVEAPPDRAPSLAGAGPFVALLSARSDELLRELARSWAAWIAAHPEAPIDAICATLALGRVHERERRAWLVSDREDLVAALEREAHGDPDPKRWSGVARRARVAFVFDGEPRAELVRAFADAGLVADAVVGGELPRVRRFSTLRELMEAVEPRIIVTFGAALTSDSAVVLDAERSQTAVLAEAHVHGVPIRWAAAFAGARRLSGAPGSAARRERYWLEPRPAAARRPSTGNHPLLGQRVLLPGPDALFQSTVSLEADPELFDHRAYQRVVVAGASQVSLLLGAQRALGGTPPVTIRSLSFAQGLIVKPHETRTVQLRVQSGEENASTFRLVSAPSGDAVAPKEVVHAVGEIVRGSNPAPAASLLPEIDAVRARSRRELDASEFYELAEGHNIQFGPTYRFNARVWAGDGEALGRLAVPSAVTDAADYDLHPGLIDSSFQLAAATGVERGNEAFILFRIREVRLYRRPEPGEALWAHAVRHTAAHENVHRFDIRLVDDAGGLVAHTVDLELRRASIQGFLRALDPSSLPELFYTVEWQTHAPPQRARPITRWLVIGDDDPPTRELCAALGADLAASLDETNPPEAIVYARALTAPVVDTTTEELLDAQRAGSLGLLEMFRALVRAGTESRTEIVVLARGALPEAPESRTDWVPVHAPLRGLCKAFAAERRGARVRFVDAGDGVSATQIAAALAAAADEPELALRGAAAWVPRLARQTQDYVTETVHLDASATYVISGGFGALGLEMAHWLASRGARRIALLARNAPSAAATMRIAELRRMDVQVSAITADVGDEVALRRAWARIDAPVRGVIHAAGMLADAPVSEQTGDRFLAPFAAKVLGAWNLHRLTRDEPLDFFLAFSSVASLFGSPAQANYAAANAFLDALASHRGGTTTSIWWGPWAEIGMAARQSAAVQAGMRAVGFELLQPSVAVEAAEQVLRMGRRQVAVMAIDSARLAGGRDRVPPLLEALVEQRTTANRARADRQAHDVISAVRSSTPAVARTLLAQYLRRLVAEAAEIDAERVDPERPLNELGLDSMMALTLQDRLETELGVSLHITRFMEKVCIEDLAEELRTALPQSDVEPHAPEPKPVPAPPPESQRAPATPRVRRVSAIVAPAPRTLEFSLFYFSRSARGSSDGYRLLQEGARFADRNGLTAVWLPERHFHEFGGLYPNPSVLAASLAATTERVRLRAGSVVLPLHHPARVVEEWAVVDNLSGGRVDLSFVRGWGPNDFVLAPESFERRTEVLVEKLDQVRRLWRGESVEFVNGNGMKTAVSVFPKPVQPELDAWLTCTRDDARFVEAGRLGTNVLTALLLQSSDDLARRIELYRRARREHGFDPRSGRVTLMLHTFIAADDGTARRVLRGPLGEYLRSSVDLWRSGSTTLDSMSEREREKVIDYAFERYYSSSGLLGTPEACLATARRFREVGVDEIACLIDFGVDDALTLEALHYLPELQARCAADTQTDAQTDTRAIG